RGQGGVILDPGQYLLEGPHGLARVGLGQLLGLGDGVADVVLKLLGGDGVAVAILFEQVAAARRLGRGPVGQEQPASQGQGQYQSQAHTSADDGNHGSIPRRTWNRGTNPLHFSNTNATGNSSPEKKRGPQANLRGEHASRKPEMTHAAFAGRSGYCVLSTRYSAPGAAVRLP